MLIDLMGRQCRLQAQNLIEMLFSVWLRYRQFDLGFPGKHRLMADADPTFMQDVFHLTQTE